MVRGDEHEASDIDFLVTFRSSARPLEQYFDAREAFERLLGRTIDLIEEGAVTNPIVQQNLNREKVLIYEA